MASKLFTSPDEAQIFETTVSFPYTLTTGSAAGAFLAALADGRILGSRCSSCERTVAPAQDVCTQCGSDTPDLIEMPQDGSIVTWTAADGNVVAKIRLDSADSDLLHRFMGDESELEAGARVHAVWSTSKAGWITDLEGFALGESKVGPAEMTPVTESGESVTVLDYRLDLDYQHSYGHYYGRMFDELGSHGRLVGSHCPSCDQVLVPPRAICDVCFVRTDRIVDVADTGVLKGFSIIHLEFKGQKRKPPYVYAEIILDGSATRLIHNVDGDFDMDRADELLSVGMRVKAVWREQSERYGTLEDIEYFEPVEDLGVYPGVVGI